MTVWFRLKLSDMEKSHLEHFDVFNEKNFPIEKEYIRNLVIVNICFLYVALIFLERKCIAGVSITIVSMLHLIFLLIFLKKENIAKKKMSLIYGIYQELLGLKCFILAYILLKKEIGKTVYDVIGVSIAVHLIIIFIWYLRCKKKIYEDQYKDITKSTDNLVFKGAPMLGIGVSKFTRSLGIKPSMVFGYILIFVAIASSESITYFLKYYCCKLLEMRDYIEGDGYPE